MLHYAVVFFIIAIVASMLGLGVIAGTAAWAARAFLAVFLILFLVSAIGGRNKKI